MTTDDAKGLIVCTPPWGAARAPYLAQAMTNLQDGARVVVFVCGSAMGKSEQLLDAVLRVPMTIPDAAQADAFANDKLQAMATALATIAPRSPLPDPNDGPNTPRPGDGPPVPERLRRRRW